VVLNPPEPAFPEARRIAQHCDGYMFFSNFNDPARDIKQVFNGSMKVTIGGEWQSALNTPIFIPVWRYLAEHVADKYEWFVKVRAVPLPAAGCFVLASITGDGDGVAKRSVSASASCSPKSTAAALEPCVCACACWRSLLWNAVHFAARPPPAARTACTAPHRTAPHRPPPLPDPPLTRPPARAPAQHDIDTVFRPSKLRPFLSRFNSDRRGQVSW
jgi:hypothetical protein